MFASTNPKQPFYVANKVNLSQDDQKVLTRLYQPLVGILGVGLYTTLASEFDTIPFAGEYKTLYQLQDQTNSNLKSIFDSLHHLEAVGLVKTFVGQNPVLGDVLIFKLRKVPSAQEYFQTLLLTSLLQERVGIVAFERLVKEFTPQEFMGLKDAQEVSAGFFDVFHLDANSAIEPPATVKQASEKVGKKQEIDLSLGQKAVNIDWDFLLELFAAYHVKANEVNRHRKEISQIITFYGMTEQDFVNNALITLSAGKDELDMHAIQAVIIENYGRERNRKFVAKQIAKNGNKKDAVATIKSLSTKDDQLLKEVNQYSTIDYLYHIKEKKGGYVTTTEKKVVYRLQNQYGLSPQLINILIHTCLEYDSVLTTTLADRIANNWLQEKVTTAAQAISYVHKWQNGRQKRTFDKSRRVKSATNWHEVQNKQANKPNSQQMSDQEMNQIFKEFGKKD